MEGKVRVAVGSFDVVFWGRATFSYCTCNKVEFGPAKMVKMVDFSALITEKHC